MSIEQAWAKFKVDESRRIEARCAEVSGGCARVVVEGFDGVREIVVRLTAAGLTTATLAEAARRYLAGSPGGSV